jgi:hypothetical protein
MIKNFVIVLPDEPYKTTTNLNKTLECTYNGPRYLAVCVKQTGDIKYFSTSGETIEELRMADQIDDEAGTAFHVLDAAVNTFEAAYLTHSYTHGDVEDYTVTHPNNLGSWSYHYDDGTGAIGQCFYVQDVKYIAGSYTAPRYREHAIKREDFLQHCIDIANHIERSLAINDYSAEDTKKLQDHAVWLKSVPTAYANIDHWKIPYPSDVPVYY